MSEKEEIVFLKKRVSELEKQIDNLRLSRRVLMDLLEQVEKEKNLLSAQLEKKYKNLRKSKRQNTERKIYSHQFEVVELKNYFKE